MKTINEMEIVVEGNETTSLSSKDDPDRVELLWETRTENMVLKWREHCLDHSKKHGLKARKVKNNYTALSIPAIILPLVLSGFSSLINPYPLVNSITLMVVSILTGMNSFFNLGKRTQEHFHYEGQYADLAMAIESEICRPRARRVAADVYMERVKNNISKLDLSAPNL
jgi:hypothetical protein